MMRNMRTAALASAVALVGSVVTANAVPITPSPTIVSGDKTFNNFTCSVVGGIGLTCGQIDVSAHTSTQPPDITAGDFGIRFQAALMTPVPGTEDVTITYTATALGSLFHDVSMWFNGTGLPSGLIATSVDEKVFDHFTHALLADLFVSNPGDFSQDLLLSADTSSIDIIKDISLASSGHAPATVSLIDQNFSQVPEPASLALFGTALVGLGLIRRRRNRGNPRRNPV